MLEFECCCYVYWTVKCDVARPHLLADRCFSFVHGPQIGVSEFKLQSTPLRLALAMAQHIAYSHGVPTMRMVLKV